jgi:hypothetical protein
MAHWGNPVTSTDLQAALQSAAGKDQVKFLTKFFEQWVY